MIPSVVAFPNERSTPSAREERLQRQSGEAFRALCDAIGKHPDKETRKLLDAYQLSEIRLQIYWEGRVSKATRDLEAALGADLSDAQRRALLTALYGAGGSARNVHALSELEREMLERYRATDADGKLVIRTLLKRFAAQPDGGLRGAAQDRP